MRVQRFMFRADFARLCDVSPSMISKYARRGLIVLRQDRWVRVADTLAALEGHLDEEKRTAALKALAKAEAALPPLLAVAGGVRRQRLRRTIQTRLGRRRRSRRAGKADATSSPR